MANLANLSGGWPSWPSRSRMTRGSEWRQRHVVPAPIVGPELHRVQFHRRGEWQQLRRVKRALGGRRIGALAFLLLHEGRLARFLAAGLGLPIRLFATGGTRATGKLHGRGRVL